MISILLVEDDRIDQIAFRRMVDQEALDYDYCIAGSISEARVLLATRRFDLIIADYHLGDGTAFDMLKAREDVPLIIVTGAGSERIAVQAMKAGACDYLTKDSARSYLTMLPFIVENAVQRSIAEREARDTMRERIRRKTLEDFVHTASHDLITPITTMGTSLHLLARFAQKQVDLTADPVLNSAALSENAGKIEQRCILLQDELGRLEQIVMDLLEMVKADSLDELPLETVELNLLIAQVVQIKQEHARRKRQALAFTPTPEPLIVEAGVHELMSVVRKLVRNAIDYTPDHGYIAVSTARIDNEVMIAVVDTGDGIPEDDLPRIFERFYRVNRARTMTAGGSGLGLAIVKRLVELHHGRIEVESKLGEGSAFRVFLPALLTD
ncbi:MAG: response regulator [Anaerolineae bacterium]|nr:response regulator [Anaerolineae bacterium]